MPEKRGPVPLAITGILVIVLVLVAAFNLPEVLRGGTDYSAEFTESAGLQAGDLVTVAGVEAGRVDAVELAGDRVRVDFTVIDAWVGVATIPLDRTASPFDVVEAFNGLSSTIDALDTEQLATSLETLSDTFRGTAPEVRGALDGLSRLSQTIASRDEEIRTLLAGTQNLSGVLADRNAEFERLLSDGNLLLAEVQRRKDAISALLDGTRELSVQLRGLVADNTEQLRPTLEALDRVAAVLERNRDNLDVALRDQAVFTRLFTNAVGSGRWFDNYVCGLVLPPVGPINSGGC
jgi:phospholipid/cholesterol/gamma-HCH transport system substrate-binding protein